MTATLHPRVSASATSCSLMLTVYDQIVATPPRVTWTLGGKTYQPIVRMPLAPVNVAQDLTRAGASASYTGLFEFANLVPGSQYDVVAQLGPNLAARARVRCWPQRLPTAHEGGFHVLLTSCFYKQQAKPALTKTLAAAVSQLPQRAGVSGPDLAMFLGDQVYLDMPITKDVPSDRTGIYGTFEAMYKATWRSDFARFLESAPAVHVSDDHEFWNNFPFRYRLAGNTKTPAGRALWTQAAAHMLARFQHVEPFRRVDVAPLSFFFADGRAWRGGGDDMWNQTLDPRALAALKQWIRDLNGPQGFGLGVFVSGQSMLSEPGNSDAAPSNFRDYDTILEALLSASCPLLLVTGDVHFGRVTNMRHPSRPAPLCEVIVSPLASVKDQRLRALNVFKRIVGIGGDQDWDSVKPKNAPAAIGAKRSFPDSRFAFPTRPNCQTKTLVQGDQLGMLSFSRIAGNRVKVTMTYWKVADKPIPINVQLDL